uniref:CRISPR-associated endoribonuclease Cas2 n=1 Tax=candidate division WOR-3 bacterium TaxID=2052148 RepID=A0A7C4UFN7_UNCW3
MNFYLISYDISNDKRRNNVSKCLENYGTRVQYSVFEVILGEEKFKELYEKLKKIIDIKKDSIRIYPLCNSCLRKTRIIGEGEITTEIEIYII